VSFSGQKYVPLCGGSTKQQVAKYSPASIKNHFLNTMKGMYNMHIGTINAEKVQRAGKARLESRI
jgi:hypothetical protein